MRLAERKSRWLEFYNLSSKRKFIKIIRYSPGLSPRPLPNPECRQARLEWIWASYTYHLERTEWLDDDTLPYLDMLTGTEIFAEAFGCRVFRPLDNNPFALPLVCNAREADALQVPSLDTPPIALVFKMADELVSKAGPGVLFRLVDLQSPMDVAALIWEKTDFYVALLETPDSVAGLLEKIKSLQFAFLDEWFRRYGKECIAHYPDYYMPHGVTLSVDEIGAVSSHLFQKYFLSDLNEFSVRYHGLGIHCCANARHQWDNFKQVHMLKLLNVNHKGSLLREAYSYFADFTTQWHYDQSTEPLGPLEWAQIVPDGAHIVIDVSASTEEEALELSEKIERLNG